MRAVRVQITARDGKISFFRLSNGIISMTTTNLGCRICELYTGDRNGKKEDILLGLADVKDCSLDNSCAGAVVGRVANRIENGCFILNGQKRQLTKNCGEHHLHGGAEGFDRKVFDWEMLDNGIRYTCLSADGEEGYPGNLELSVTYLMEDDCLRILYDAVSDADTLLNVTNHMYFNLDGSDSVLEHELKIAAQKMVPVRSDGIPDGGPVPVAGSPFDFRDFHRIGERIFEPDPMLEKVNGYDHPFLLDQKEDAVILRERKSGRCVLISTDMPCVQVYSGNFLAGKVKSKKGRPFLEREGVALETQFLPDSINREPDSPTVLKAGQRFHSETDYRFRADLNE